MRGGFDLYGNYYPNPNDALNAEMAQCNEIDNRINQQKIRELELRLKSPSIREPTDQDYQIAELFSRIEALEKQVDELKRKEENK